VPSTNVKHAAFQNVGIGSPTKNISDDDSPELVRTVYDECTSLGE
jgi:hypothetical protein